MRSGDRTTRRWAILAGLLAIGAVAVAVWVLSSSDAGAEPGSAPADKWMKCEACGATRQVTVSELDERFPRIGQDPLAPQPVVCESCGKQAVYPALKCPQCGTVFAWRAGQIPALVACPKCGWTQAAGKTGRGRRPSR